MPGTDVVAASFGFTYGTSHTQSTWDDTRHASWPDLVELLTSHVPGPKEGKCIVPAVFTGNKRKKEEASQIDVAFLDSDSGATLDEIVSALKAQDWEAVVSSTHSHMATKTEVSLTNWDRFFAKHPDAVPADFLEQDKGYLASVAQGAHVVLTTDDRVHIEHAPCPKFRIAVPLAKPWRAADYPSQAQANAVWKERIEALAAALGLWHDQACTDTSRLFYLPRRPPNGAVPETAVVSGQCCDIFSIPVPAAPDLLTSPTHKANGHAPVNGATRHEYTDAITGEIIDLTSWAREYGADFLIAKALHAKRPSAITNLIVDSKVHIRCPNEGAHTIPGQDGATFVVNAGQGDTKGFVIHCRHAHCTGHDRLFFVGRMLSERWLTVEDLTAAEFLIEHDVPETGPDWPDEAPEVEGAVEPASPSDGRIAILIQAGRVDLLATETESALVASGIPVFQRGRELVRPATQEVPASKGRMTISAGMGMVSHAGMIDLMAQAIDWRKYDGRKKREAAADPPGLVASVLLARTGQWKFPTVAGVITTPTLRPDGSVLFSPGYDAATRLYHVADPNLVPEYIPDQPTGLDAQAALETLRSLLDEFQFVSDTDLAVALSGLMTPLVRGAIPVAPLHAVRASTAGTGKSYYVDVVSAIVNGRPAPVMSVSVDAKETESRMNSLLLAGFPLVSIDNVNGELGSDILAQAVERPVVQVRRLGVSEVFEVESRATWFATGNNLRVRGDMTRRTVISTMDAGVERPEMRVFRHRPADEAALYRGKYIAAILTIVRAYIVAGKPDRLPSPGSYEGWSDLVRSPLVWLGLPDPWITTETAREDDPEISILSDVLSGWVAAVGATRAVTVREVIETATARQTEMDTSPGELLNPDFRASLLQVAGVKGAIDPVKLGKWLLGRESRIINNMRLKRGDRDTHSKVATWKVI